MDDTPAPGRLIYLCPFCGEFKYGEHVRVCYRNPDRVSSKDE